MVFRRRFKRGYRRVFGHKSPFRRVFGSRNAGQAIGVSYRQLRTPMHDLAQLAREVRGIKARQNVEKKHKEAILTGADDEAFHVGQVNDDFDGSYGVDVTPAITQGIQHDQRVGNSLKLTGIAFKYQINAMEHCQQKMKVKLTLVKISSPDIASVSTAEVINMMYDVNPLTNVRDTNAPLNYATLKQNGIKIIRTHTCYLPAQETSVQGGFHEYKAHKTSSFSVAMQDIVRFASASATTPEGHRYMMIFQADTGNWGANNSTKADIPITKAQTGANIRMHAKYWWVDN